MPGDTRPKTSASGVDSESVTVPDIWKALEDLRKELAAQRKPDGRWMDLKQAAEYASLSSKSVRRIVQSGALRAHRPVAQKIIIDKRDLDDYLKQS